MPPHKLLEELEQELRDIKPREILMTWKDVEEFIRKGLKRRYGTYRLYRKRGPAPPVFKAVVEQVVAPPPPVLTRRQLTALRLREEGLSYREIGRRMGIAGPNVYGLVKRGEKNAKAIETAHEGGTFVAHHAQVQSSRS